jgi:hypothetical protein
MMLIRRAAALIFLVTMAAVGRAAEIPLTDSTVSPGPNWHNDYHQALDQAQAQRKMALVWFFDPHRPTDNERFSRDVLSDRSVMEAIESKYVCAKLATDVVVTSGGNNIRLLDHSAFQDLQRMQGLAVIDMSDEGSPLFRQVVSVYPFARGPITLEKLLVMLELPRGTLTQRTLIFAVRTHPESPQSTAGQLSETLARESESHSQHQANIRLQGHHNWEQRFHSINAQVSGGLVAQEVCAESWPGQTLVDAAEECVHSWRQSSGHWSAVRSPQTLFAYDMKRGTNGIWYGTGIFASPMR